MARNAVGFLEEEDDDPDWDPPLWVPWFVAGIFVLLVALIFILS